MIPMVYLELLFWCSLLALMTYSFIISMRIQRFIVKRYELETNLLDTACFRNHATFTRYLPDFFSSAMYSAHLMMFLCAWKFIKNRKAYKDIKDPVYVTRHFSKKEIRLVKCYWISSSFVASQVVACLIIGWLWPDSFVA